MREIVLPFFTSHLWLHPRYLLYHFLDYFGIAWKSARSLPKLFAITIWRICRSFFLLVPNRDLLDIGREQCLWQIRDTSVINPKNFEIVRQNRKMRSELMCKNKCFGFIFGISSNIWFGSVNTHCVSVPINSYISWIPLHRCWWHSTMCS